MLVRPLPTLHAVQSPSQAPPPTSGPSSLLPAAQVAEKKAATLSASDWTLLSLLTLGICGSTRGEKDHESAWVYQFKSRNCILPFLGALELRSVTRSA
jgi:hypothetical protein